MSYRCRCVWDCSHAWCGCDAHSTVVCVCGTRPHDCPVHGSTVAADPPCDCSCHTFPGVMHVAACCNRPIAGTGSTGLCPPLAPDEDETCTHTPTCPTGRTN